MMKTSITTAIAILLYIGCASTEAQILYVGGTSNWVPASGDAVWDSGVDTYPGDGTYPTNTANVTIGDGQNVTLSTNIDFPLGNRLYTGGSGTLTIASGGSFTGAGQLRPVGTGWITVDSNASVKASILIMTSGTTSFTNAGGTVTFGGMQMRNSTFVISGGTLTNTSSLTLNQGNAPNASSTFRVEGSDSVISLASINFGTGSNSAPTVEFQFDSGGISKIHTTGSISMNGLYVTCVLNVEFNGYISDGKTALTLFNYGGSRSGVFETTNILNGGSALLPGTKGSLGPGEFALDYNDAGQTIDLYANTNPSSTVIMIR